MDPNACLNRLLESFADGDHEDVRFATADLKEWLQRGGVMPEVGTARFQKLLIIIQIYSNRTK